MTRPFSGAAAESYDAGRALYLPDVVAALELPPPPARVLDLAAGTGLLSRALLGAGHEVVAVESERDMAARLPEGAEHIAGTAEATGLPATSVDAVVVGDAWHWFDASAAADEVHRILRPRGRLAIVWRSSVEAERPAALAGFHARLQAVPDTAPPRNADLLAGHAGFAPLVHRRVAFLHRTDAGGLLAEAASISAVNLLPRPEREALLADLREELTRAGVGTVAVPYVAEVSRTTRRR